MKPQGQHSCVVCTGTACYIKGAGEILAAIENEFGVKPDETTEDGKAVGIDSPLRRCLRTGSGSSAGW